MWSSACLGKFQLPGYSVLIGIKIQTDVKETCSVPFYLLVYSSVESFFLTLPPLNPKPCPQTLCKCVARLCIAPWLMGCHQSQPTYSYSSTQAIS